MLQGSSGRTVIDLPLSRSRRRSTVSKHFLVHPIQEVWVHKAEKDVKLLCLDLAIIRCRLLYVGGWQDRTTLNLTHCWTWGSPVLKLQEECTHVGVCQLLKVLSLCASQLGTKWGVETCLRGILEVKVRNPCKAFQDKTMLLPSGPVLWIGHTASELSSVGASTICTT